MTGSELAQVPRPFAAAADNAARFSLCVLFAPERPGYRM